MPDLDKPPWSDLVAWIKAEVLPLLLIVVVAVIALRLARIFVHGIVKTLLDREATEGTAQELSAVEIAKRMDTLDALARQRPPLLHPRHRRPDDPGRARARHRARASPGLGVVGIAVGFGAQSMVRDYLNGALILVENQFAQG